MYLKGKREGKGRYIQGGITGNEEHIQWTIHGSTAKWENGMVGEKQVAKEGMCEG